MPIVNVINRELIPLVEKLDMIWSAGFCFGKIEIIVNSKRAVQIKEEKSHKIVNKQERLELK